MKIILRHSFTAFVLFVLIVSFVVFISLLAVARKNPSFVISYLKQLTPTATPDPLHLKGIAVLGDSQSDEYQADDKRGVNFPSTTLNWVELLSQYRKLNFGPWGVYDEPRRTGYAYDWARTGATANSLLESGQHIGAAEQVKEGKVNLVIIYIGANDFAPYITGDGYEAIYNGTLTDAALLRKENRLVADILTAVDTVKSAGNTKILLVKIPDWGRHVVVQIAFPNLDQRSRVTQAITVVNDALQREADARGIPTADPNVFYDALPKDPNSTKVKVGNVTLENLILNDDPRNMFLSDGIHLGTVMNGLFANFLIQHINSDFGTYIKPFTNSEILSNAGLEG